MGSLTSYLSENKEWLFSGTGLTCLTLIGLLLRRLVSRRQSAGSALDVQRAAEQSERRGAVRGLVVVANEILVEIRHVKSRAADLKLSYQDLFDFSGGPNSSQELLRISAIEEKVATVTALSSEARALAVDVAKLEGAALDDVNRKHAKLAQTLTEVRSIREDLEREQASVDAQCAQHREAVIHGRQRR